MNRVNEQLGLHGTFGQNLLRIHTDLQAEKTANVTACHEDERQDALCSHSHFFPLFITKQ